MVGKRDGQICIIRPALGFDFDDIAPLLRISVDNGATTREANKGVVMPERNKQSLGRLHQAPDSNPGTRLSPCGQRRRKVFNRAS